MIKRYRRKNFLLKISLIIWLFAASICTFSQDYAEYYKYIDSAKFYLRSDNVSKINECYQHAFSSNRGFADDYSNAIVYDYFEKKELNYFLAARSFRDGLIYNDLKSSLTANKIVFSKKKLKRIYRKNRLKKKKSSFKLHRILIKDQLARRLFHRSMHKIDSITSVKIIRLLKTEPELFNRFQTGFVGSEVLGVLMLHCEWKRLEPIQDSIHNFTKKGLIT
jgi:hypothetical protein